MLRYIVKTELNNFLVERIVITEFPIEDVNIKLNSLLGEEILYNGEIFNIIGLNLKGIDLAVKDSFCVVLRKFTPSITLTCEHNRLLPAMIFYNRLNNNYEFDKIINKIR